MLNYKDFKKHNEMKKFSNISKTKKTNDSPDEELDNSGLGYEEEINVNILNQDRPVKGMSNSQSNIKDTKRHSNMGTKAIQPNDESEYHEKGYTPSKDMGTTNMEDKANESKKEGKVKLIGKIADFPNDTEASKAYNFLENVKISKNKIWYILVEKQSNELQMVKYSAKKGVNLSEFVNELKKFYITKYEKSPKLVSKLERIELGGDKDGNFSSIKNIPNLTIDGKKLIRKIKEDLTDLLSGNKKK